MDELGLTLRAELVWSKPNGLPQSVTDRFRRSHETWFHFTTAPRYYAAVDEIGMGETGVVVGRRPRSVWAIPTQPLRVPAELGIDHFAAFPMEWPRRLIQGWSPRAVCTACGQGQRPVVQTVRTLDGQPVPLGGWQRGGVQAQTAGVGNWRYGSTRHVRGYACACPDTAAPHHTGRRAGPVRWDRHHRVGRRAAGRIGISVDASADYCRLATWRASHPQQRAKAAAPTTPAPARAARRRPTARTATPARDAA